LVSRLSHFPAKKERIAPLKKKNNEGELPTTQTTPIYLYPKSVRASRADTNGMMITTRKRCADHANCCCWIRPNVRDLSPGR
jgi:hypothetical protein